MKKQKGFTLIELLIVISILAILTAVSIPKIDHMMKESKTKASIKSTEKTEFKKF